MFHRRLTPVVCLSLVVLLGGVSAVHAQGAAPRYLTPPKAIVDILDAAPLPGADVSPTHDTVVLLVRRNMPSVGELAQPMLALAGSRVNPNRTGPHRPALLTGLTLKSIADGAERPVTLPADSTLFPVGFSPDGKWYAFARNAPTSVELWTVDVRSAKATKLHDRLNAPDGPDCSWLDDSSALVCLTVPTRRGAPPVRPAAPSGPNIQENAGRPTPTRTYQDLLTSAHDEALFAYYFTSEISLVPPAGGKATVVGTPGLFEAVRPSPDGRFLLIEVTKPPFSRVAPRGEFPKDVEVWTRTGSKVRAIASVPSGETAPLTGVVTGPRMYRWQANAPATLVWAEALDGGDLKNKVPQRDKVVALAAPFTGDPVELLKTEHRFSSIRWTETGIALVTENERATRRTRTWLIDKPGASPRKLWDRSVADGYTDPGLPVVNETGAILQEGPAIYLTGRGSSPSGDRPFLDRLDLQTLKAERLFQSDAKGYENVEALLSKDGRSVLTRAESRRDPPNYFVRTLPGDARRALTQFTDPAPQLAGVQKRLITYKRDDGVDLSATLYLPPDYKEGTRLPVMVWAYPREFTSAADAGQVRGSNERFTLYGGPSHLLLLTQGYAILDNPSMPIIGEGETANDTYVKQLVAGAKAAIDKVVEMGVADRDRIGVGGHSYGAFMTANLLAQSDLFRAGIARSGAYNRTLTPFGFQSETRTFWDVPQVYVNMSPFWFANKINEPILLIHGEADDNSGTFPIQSERMYVALKGHGATVRYVTLPYEAHGYLGRESVLHTLAEMTAWADKYVKQAPARTPATSSPAQ